MKRLAVYSVPVKFKFHLGEEATTCVNVAVDTNQDMAAQYTVARTKASDLVLIQDPQRLVTKVLQPKHVCSTQY